MSALGWDEGRIYHAHVLPGEDQSPDAPSKLVEQFYEFILEFRIDNSYIYRDQLQTNIVAKKYVLDVNVEHLILANEHLADKLKNEPADMLPLFEQAVKQYALKKILLASGEVNPNHGDWRSIPDCQVTLNSNENTTSIRDLNASTISKFVRIPGIVISASHLSSKATHLCLLCKGCRSTRFISVGQGLTGITLPRTCNRENLEGEDREPCPLDPYIIVHEKCTFIDQQTLKLQEAPDMVPVGELPRHILLSSDRYLTNRITPGTRCTILGIYSIFQNKKGGKSSDGAVAVRNPYVRVVGISIDAAGNSKEGAIFSPEQEEEFLEMSRRPDFYEVFSRSIGPSIYGNADIKKAIACLLFGGSKKILPDGMKLRGDINVLLLGDPGTAKSQLLKFVEKVAPIAVYTSGKGSSAAGLTASVQRDANTREFYLEGGAMVLADGGVVCIDEFDKMRDEDRVAIHEAMEQQTISIAKAGITTILNSRASVLAAANPIFGRYDDMKSPGDNIDFQTTILSRFDLIFIVKDTHDAGRDRSIAQHVLSIHINRAVTDMPEGEIPIDKMRSYIRFAKSRCAPRLNDEAAETLSSHFVEIRRQVHQVEQDSNERSSIPITIRQLEAIIRVSESLAKMTLSTVVTREHVNEAVRLFNASTMDAVNNGGSEVRKDLNDHVAQIEEEIKKRVPVGFSANYRGLVDHFCRRKEFSEHALERAIWVLERKEVIQVRNQRQKIYRIGV